MDRLIIPALVALLAFGCDRDAVETAQDVPTDPQPPSNDPTDSVDPGGPPSECPEGSDGEACDDGKPCTVNDQCDGGVCVGGASKVCTDKDVPQCQTAECNPDTGDCEAKNVEDGKQCANGCFLSDAGAGGICKGGECKKPDNATAVDCSEQELPPCVKSLVCNQTDGKCIPAVTAEEGEPCNLDESLCTVDICGTDGECVAGAIDDCAAENAAAGDCQVFNCFPLQGCQSKFNAGGGCDDGDECTEADQCKVNEQGLQGCYGTPIDKDDDNQCTTNTCIDGNWTYPAASGACEPTTGSCTKGTCQAKVCIWNEALCECNKGTDCYPDGEPVGGCAPQQECQSNAEGFAECVAVEGSGEPPPGPAPDCMQWVCDTETGAWGTQPTTGGACSDGDPCTEADACVAGKCEGSPITCDDGNACNGIGACVAGECVTSPTNCDDGNPCTDLDCDPVKGCLYTQNSAPCDDLTDCTAGDVCANGSCNGVAYTCKTVLCGTTSCDGKGGCAVDIDSDSCLIDDACYAAEALDPTNDCQACKPLVSQTGWTALDDGDACDDGEPCTGADACAGGTCEGSVDIDCPDDGLACTTSACNGVGCDPPTAIPGWCAIDGVCYAAGALGPNPCQHCDPAKPTVWVNRPPGAECDDGEACTKNEVCQSGLCKGEVFVCDDGDPCTDDTCVAEACTFPLAADKCSIAEACVGAGELNPDNDCQACNPSKEQSDWSNRDPGEPCDDGEACTWKDSCQFGACKGTESPCGDALTCTLDLCDSKGGCTYELQDGACKIDGVCIAAGAANPENPCQWCQPAMNPEAWSDQPVGTPCVDDLFCTVSETCAAGSCTGAQKDCTAQNGACAVGVCDEDGDTCTAQPVENGTICNDGKPCTAGDQCTAGTCAGETGTTPCCEKDIDCDDGKACTTDTCVAGTGQCTYEHALNAGKPCADGQFCTVGDACAADGSCEGTPRDCAGLDDACNLGQCDEASDACVPFPANEGAACPDDGNPCTDDTCVAGGCAHPPNLSTCNDDNPCTSGDDCAAGTCAGDAYTCDDELPCTTDLCDGEGGCTATLADGFCTIGNACVPAGAPNPTTPCLICSPAESTSSWSPAPSTVACDDDEPCTSADHCQDGACDGSPAPCEDGLACTANVCDGEGGCSFPAKPGSCLIDGACHPAGAPNPANACQACAPLDTQLTWSNVENGTACNDGEACTHADSCTAGQCGGTSAPCSDELECTDDVCDGEGGCSYPPSAGLCLIDGVCFASGDTDPENQCQECNPTLATEIFVNKSTGTACDDGKPCTSGDACADGGCSGTVYSCADGKECTSDVCDGTGGCSNPVASDSCLIAGACVAAGTPKPDNQCQHCDPGTLATDWVNRPEDSGCNDEAVCTTDDVCKAGLCKGTLLGGCCDKDSDCNDSEACTLDTCDVATGDCVFDPAPKEGGECDDLDFCTVDESCAGGTCTGADRDCSAAGDACNVGVCDKALSQCVPSPKPGQPACDDAEGCSSDDKCVDGVCAGTEYDCADELTCTDDVCDGVGGCTNNPAEGFCVIGGACVAAGEVSPGDECLVCEPTTSSSAWSPAPASASCNDGDPCTEDDVCLATGCGGAPVDCSGLDDLPCVLGVCAAGTCEAQTQPCTATGITLSVPSAALHAPGAVTLRVSIGQTGPTGVSAGSNQTIHFGFHPSVQH